MKRTANVVLGIVTSIGGFVEAGSISTSIQAGAEFHFALLWAIALAAALVAALLEMSGRLAALSRQTFASAVRERFGFPYQLVLLAAELIIDLLLLTAELGGAATAVQLVTKMDYRWWLPAVALLAAVILWFSSFAVIENGLGLLGLITLAFLVGAWRMHPPAASVARGLLPSLPTHTPARYAFFLVTIVGATVSPYLLNFYGSGAVEEKWSERDLLANRITAAFGMGFGAVVSMGVLVCAAVAFGAGQERISSFEAASRVFGPVFGGWGTALFAASLGIGCVGAAVEIALNLAYVAAQGFGWPWGTDRSRANSARFSCAFLATLFVALLIALSGLDPLAVTLVSVGLTVILMPLVVLPMLVLMNDERLVKDHRNGPVGNVFLAALTLLGAVLALVVVPLELGAGG